ncbi:acyltransferase family protein [Draconibacterium sediminis]|uniref:acyltransferase family protein n=1 Tax=Draconibacterium sediminis TaxID=1544798 RepID=UPI0026EB42FE|nr:acyltransferase family protein [Draconibacterium sediminis]
MKTRIYFLDHLRTLMIFLVVVLHSGLVYEHVLQNSWIVVDPVKANSIGMIRLYLDLFIMFTIFFISGYLVPMSLKSKTSVEFIKSKVKRILIPWVIAVFTLIPAYKFIFLYSRGLPQEEWFSYFHFFERAGSDLSFYANNPAQNWLWFLPVLFLFQVIYLVLAKTKVLSLKINLKTAVIVMFVVGVVSSVTIAQLGLNGWNDSAILHFQRERLLVYFMSFLLGTLCYKLKVFESTNKNKRLYIIANVVLTFTLGIFTAVALNTFFNIIDPQRNYYFISQFADRVAYYAFGLASQLTLLYVFLYGFRHSLNKRYALMDELNRNSYSVYIIHTIVLGVVALSLMALPIPPMVKFLMVTLLTFALSNLLIYSWRTIRQREINTKTVATAILSVVIVMAAFTAYPGTTEKNEEKKTETTETKTAPQRGNSIHAAVIAGNIAAVKAIIAAGADLNEKEPAGGSSPLMTACVFGKTEIAQVLIDAGADLNVTNNDGSTALHTAAFFCRTEIVKALLNKGIDTSVVNNSGATAAQSVMAPFEVVKGIYEYFAKVYEPLGLQLDLNRIEKTRPVIAEIISTNS